MNEHKKALVFTRAFLMLLKLKNQNADNTLNGDGYLGIAFNRISRGLSEKYVSTSHRNEQSATVGCQLLRRGLLLT